MAAPDAQSGMVVDKAAGENFPVAPFFIPRAWRAGLMAVYGYARLVDDIGDGDLADGGRHDAVRLGLPAEAAEDRLAMLDAVEADLRRVFDGTPSHPLLGALQPTVRTCGLTPEPFLSLIEANRQDQRVRRYATYDDLLAYCELSANPVGRLVLEITGSAGPERVRCSDAICTALQIVEHLQDVAEDLGRDRVYLPAEDMKRFGVTEADLAAPTASPQVRALVAFEAERARDLLNEGAPLVSGVHGRLKLLLAGFVGGGRAALKAIEDAEYDVLLGSPKPTRFALLREVGSALGRQDVSRKVKGSPRTSGPALAAYRYCEAVTGQQARNFAYGIRLLPTPKRQAMSALYAFSRRVDDIGDGELPPAVKQERLDEARTVLARIRDDDVAEDDTDLIAVALADAARRFPIPLGALDELIDGVQMDVRGYAYETWEDLAVYCRRVAGTVGRLSLGVFGTIPGVADTERAVEYADTLGLALQLTNILRDVREDAANGRTYLPADELAKFGCATGFHTSAPPPGGNFAELIVFEVRRARSLFAVGYRLLPMLDRRSGACVAAMAGIYRRLLERIAADPEAVLRSRLSLPAHEKAYIAARGLVGLDTRRAARGPA